MSVPVPMTTTTNNASTELKMRGLNKSFLSSAQKLFETAPEADFSKLFDQYKNHLATFTKIEAPSISAATTVTFPTLTAAPVTAAPATTTFAFPAAPSQPASIPVMKPVEPIKPVFEVPKPIESKPVEPVKSVFEAPKPTEPVKSVFEAPKPAEPMLFTKPAEPIAPLFGLTKLAEPVKPSTEPFKPLFEAPKPTEPVKTTEGSTFMPFKPSEPFKLPEPLKTEATKISEPEVTKTDEPVASTVPAFKPFSFGSTDSSSAVPAFKPFSFGSTEAVNPSTASASASTVAPDSTAPAFKPFSFGSSSATTPFTFGSTTGTGTNNNSTSTTKLPSFSFGASAAAAPTSAFSFSMPPPPASKESGDEDNEIPAEEAESFTLTRTNNDQLKTGAGEENETCQHEERCKVFMMERGGANGWIDLGVGIFKINRYNNEKGKSRVLCRAEGSGKVILNTLVNVPGMDVSTIEGKKECALLAIGPDGKPTKYLIRVKTLEQAESLKAAILAEIDYIKANKLSSSNN